LLCAALLVAAPVAVVVSGWGESDQEADRVFTPEPGDEGTGGEGTGGESTGGDAGVTTEASRTPEPPPAPDPGPADAAARPPPHRQAQARAGRRPGVGRGAPVRWRP
ncbi:hypothetical protein, partial [Blastococcus sp. CCUG 61487]|uniref:hypothetical protein n=1 Tax=Blastococcus sp. CCUG 61487 TaxID=1840703 RepID=UPI001BB0477D